jgi:DNA-binding CsgD family transcriptional regulator
VKEVIWKCYKNTNYLISNTGEVFSKKTNKVLKQQINPCGYNQVTLYLDGDKINCRVHRLVTSVFLGDSDLQVNHIDGVKTNNCLENLEYVTSKENHEHAIRTGLMPLGSLRPFAKLIEEDVVTIKRLMMRGLSDQEISEKVNTVTATISKIRQGKRWKHVLPELNVPRSSKQTSENSRGKRKLTAEEVLEIRNLYEDGKSLAEIGRSFKVHSGTIDAIVKRKTWKNI